jgi:dCTP deaminase
MSVLTKNEILEELRKGQSAEGLVITPLLNGINDVGTSSVDLHLGHEFIVFRKARVTSINIARSQEVAKNINKYQEKVRISRGQTFILHPHQLVLGASIEYISLPGNIAATIEGRSTWGRTGLVIATATKIDPGFKGCPTLELVNEGEVPLVLYPGLCVAQIILTKTHKTTEYKGTYYYATGPEFPKLLKEFHNLLPFYKPDSSEPA